MACAPEVSTVVLIAGTGPSRRRAPSVGAGPHPVPSTLEAMDVALETPLGSPIPACAGVPVVPSNPCAVGASQHSGVPRRCGTMWDVAKTHAKTHEESRRGVTTTSPKRILFVVLGCHVAQAEKSISRNIISIIAARMLTSLCTSRNPQARPLRRRRRSD